MLGFLKKLWPTSCSPSISATKENLVEETAVLQPQKQQSPTSQAVLSELPQPSLYLDAAWALSGSKKTMLPIGTKLWHGGIVGPKNPATNLRGIWTTRNQDNKNWYDAWALDEAKKAGLHAYVTEFETNKDILIIDLNRYPLNPFTLGLCGGHHNVMKQEIMNWLKAKQGIGGIVAINGDQDEVVIGFPEDHLKVVQHVQI